MKTGISTTAGHSEVPPNYEGGFSPIADGAKLLTILEVSSYLSIKRKTLYAKVESGEIPHYRIGHLVRFRLEDINAWLERCRRGDSRQSPVPKRRRAISGRSGGSFDKIVTKIIDEETEKYYPVDYGKSDRIEDLGKEVNHGPV
jgi:excisionase family DNA binding protein